MNDQDKADLLAKAVKGDKVKFIDTIHTIIDFPLTQGNVYTIVDKDNRGVWLDGDLNNEQAIGWYVFLEEIEWAEIIPEKPAYLIKDNELVGDLYLEFTDKENARINIRLVDKGSDFEWSGEHIDLLNLLNGSELSRLQSENKALKEKVDNLSWNDILIHIPTCYETGNWDGERSEFLIVETEKGILEVARCYKGAMDGSEFQYWATEDDYEVEQVVKWKRINN